MALYIFIYVYRNRNVSRYFFRDTKRYIVNTSIIADFWLLSNWHNINSLQLEHLFSLFITTNITIILLNSPFQNFSVVFYCVFSLLSQLVLDRSLKGEKKDEVALQLPQFTITALRMFPTGRENPEGAWQTLWIEKTELSV